VFVIGELDRQEANPFFYLFRAVNDKLFYKYPTRKESGRHARDRRKCNDREDEDDPVALLLSE
jgi:hypothetical protein